jgi:hypothetical protein
LDSDNVSAERQKLARGVFISTCCNRATAQGDFMNSFTVLSAAYDGTFPTQQPGATQTTNNPEVLILGLVNGVSTFAYLFYALLQKSALAGDMQNLLTAALYPFYLQRTNQFNVASPYVLPSYPQIANSAIPAPVTGLKFAYGDPRNTISFTQALIAPWTA